jgi:ribosomal protein S18 acetylase RimI-like enzyme
MEIIIKSLETTSFGQLFNAFSKAFKDYEMQVTHDELYKMIHRRGYNAKLSFGAFNDDDLVSFTLNGTGIYNDLLTAYDTGTGTLESFRGNKLAGKIFNHSISFLKYAGVNQYLLEVLQHNKTAVKVYKDFGFKVSREFLYYVLPEKTIKYKHDISAKAVEITSITLEQCIKNQSFNDYEPSWQNSFESISRDLNSFRIRGVLINSELAGYCISEPTTGDITQLAVHKEFRRNGIGYSLLKDAIDGISHHSFKIINVDTRCQSMISFLSSCGIESKGKQYEMILTL